MQLKNKLIYTNEVYDTTMIEINSEKENINNFLELDEKIFEDIININNKSVYILQYPTSFLFGQKAAVSYGIIKNIEKKFKIIHYCSNKKYFRPKLIRIYYIK